MPASLIALLCALPFLCQGALMVADEFVYHRRRGLGRWEAIGHPLDTITVAAALSFLLLAERSVTNFLLFAGLAVFSCLFVTKDEFVHQAQCSPAEHWLHALLFLLHPAVFFAAGFLWWSEAPLWPLRLQIALVSLFGLYQLFYWRKRAVAFAR